MNKEIVACVQPVLFNVRQALYPRNVCVARKTLCAAHGKGVERGKMAKRPWLT